jgi:two-component system, LytTR family, response regulator
VFLDVRLPELDGFGVIEGLSGAHLPVIIFITAHDRFALRAFEVHAADYLLKPFDRERFQTALQRARQRLQGNPIARNHQSISEVLAAFETRAKPLERLTIKSQGRISFVATAEIDWICAADNYVELHVGKATHLLRTSINALADQLPKNQFVRISRSKLVNSDRIKEMRSKPHGDYLLLLHDGTHLSGSRTYRQNLAPLLGKSR